MGAVSKFKELTQLLCFAVVQEKFCEARGYSGSEGEWY